MGKDLCNIRLKLVRTALGLNTLTSPNDHMALHHTHISTDKVAYTCETLLKLIITEVTLR